MQIELKNATYAYNIGMPYYTPVLEGLELAIAKGELLALIGPSGAGKSTLSMLISGLYLPTAGKVMVNGKEASKKSHFKNVGLVFQYPEQQFFSETVFDEISFGPLNYGVAKTDIEKIVYAALNDVGLEAKAFSERSPFSLSGGEKRRVAIAAVLALDPEILIFDEPTAGLDATGRCFIIDLARRENKKGKTVIWISHNMDEVAALADRVIVLANGYLVLDGSAEDVFSLEDRLLDMGLSIPRAKLLLNRLRERGYEVPGKALTIDGAFKEIVEAGRKSSC